MKMIKFFMMVFAIFATTTLWVFWVDDYVGKLVDTRLLDIPISCLDANGDGLFDHIDINYRGYSNIDKDEISLELMDAKGSTNSVVKHCPMLKLNPYKKLIRMECRWYCRLNGYFSLKGSGD